MKTFILCLFILVPFGREVWGQAGRLTGIVYEQDAYGNRKPVDAGTSVFIPGVAASTTESTGAYSLSLTQCAVCTPGQTVRVYVNSPAGYATQDLVIPVHGILHPYDITVVPNSRLMLYGIVRNARSGKFIRGIRVTAVIQNSETNIPTVTTDSAGVFRIIINKTGIGTMQAIRLLFSDGGNGGYKDHSETVFINRFDPVTVELEQEEAPGTTIQVSHYIETSINVQIGDKIKIHAEGVIKVGVFVGTSGPGGIPGNKGVLNVSLARYNLFPDWNHGALLFRFGPDDTWRYYDDKGSNEFMVQTAGNIEFNINDNKQEDNSGYYTVVVTKK